MSQTKTREPSGWQIMKMLEIATQHLNVLQADTDPETSRDEPTDAEALMELLRVQGADVRGIMEALVLAGDEAKNDAEAIKWRIDKLRIRQARRTKKNEAIRNATMAIMATLPELFPPPSRSKALAAFVSPLVDARVQRGKPGVQITNPEKLMKEERFVTKSLNEAAVRTAILEDGEVLDGAETKNGAPFLVVKTS